MSFSDFIEEGVSADDPSPSHQAGTYLPQSYLIHEEMIVTERLERVDQLGYFIYNLCRGKETFKLQRRDRILGKDTETWTYDY